MAYAYTVTGPYVVGSLRIYEIVETDVGPTDEWEIDLPGELWHTALQVVDLVVAGSASTLTPELGTLAGWTSGGRGHVTTPPSAAANYRGQEAHTVLSTDRKLYGRSVPDVATGASGEIHTLIALRPGAAP